MQNQALGWGGLQLSMKEQQAKEARQQQKECKAFSFLQREEEKESFLYGISQNGGLPNFSSFTLAQNTKRVGSSVPYIWPAIRLSSCLSGIPGVLRNTREREWIIRIHLFGSLNLRSPRVDWAFRSNGPLGSSYHHFPGPCAHSSGASIKKAFPTWGLLLPGYRGSPSMFVLVYPGRCFWVWTSLKFIFCSSIYTLFSTNQC